MDYVKESFGLALLQLLERTLLNVVHSIQSNNQVRFMESAKKQDNFGAITTSEDMESISVVFVTLVWWVGDQILEEVLLIMLLNFCKRP